MLIWASRCCLYSSCILINNTQMYASVYVEEISDEKDFLSKRLLVSSYDHI